MSDRKTTKGRTIRSLDTVRDMAEHGFWFYLRDKPKHPTIIENMSFETVAGFVSAGMLHTAEDLDNGTLYRSGDPYA